MIERLPIALALIIIGLICYMVAHRPALSKKEERELKQLDNKIAELFGGKR